jgi:teichuronic acid biosynthesis glycosyltransferase TuaC
MHVLVIPSEQYLAPEAPLAGCFQRDQARALEQAGIRAGVIAPKPRNLRTLLHGLGRWSSGLRTRDDEGVTVTGYDGWSLVPERFALSVRVFTDRGLRLFESYVAEHGLPDVVHAHGSVLAGTLALRLKEIYGTPYVITEHSSAFLTDKLLAWHVPVVKAAFAQADYKAVVSRSLGAALEERLGADVCPWYCIPNILPEIFRNASVYPKEARHDKCFGFLSVGSLVKVKNYEGLIMAFAEVSHELSGVELRIGGDGPLLSSLQRQARAMNCESHVTFLGSLARKQVLDEMRKCDGFVLPSDRETFGLVLIEALSCGTPVIATACGGPEDIVEEMDGFLVPPGEPHALASAMKALYAQKNSYDPQQIRARCLARFGESAIVSALRKAYEKVL